MYVTKEGFEKVTTELEHLRKVRRPEIANRIKDAKEMGDLSENAEYADAREEQSFVEGRILELEEMLKNIQVITNGSSNSDVVEIGDTVVVERDGEHKQYTIVGSSEADPAGGRISNESPMGRAFLGKSKNSVVKVATPRGEIDYKIIEIKS